MKMPCHVIRDLLPLYLDRVCSEESRELVETHLEHCPECKAYCDMMAEPEWNVDVSASERAASESQKVDSFRAVKKRIFHRQILAAVFAVLIFVGVSASVIGVLKSIVRTVPYENNLSVSMVDGSLLGRLYGSEYTNVKIRNVSVDQDGHPATYLFYQVSDTVWADLSTRNDMMTEYVLCPAEKNAAEINRVYYYTGDYTGLDSLSGAELQAVIQEAVLLWEKTE